MSDPRGWEDMTQDEAIEQMGREVAAWIEASVIGLSLQECVERWNAEPLERRKEVLAMLYGCGDVSVPGGEITQVEFVYEPPPADDPLAQGVTVNIRLARPIEQVYFTCTVTPPEAILGWVDGHGHCLRCPVEGCGWLWELRPPDERHPDEEEKGREVYRGHYSDDHPPDLDGLDDPEA